MAKPKSKSATGGKRKAWPIQKSWKAFKQGVSAKRGGYRA